MLRDYLEGRARWPFEPAFPDDDAGYEQTITINLSDLELQVVLPDRVAWNTKGAGEVATERIKVDQAFIGSCANGRISDFAVAARDSEGQDDRTGNAHDRDPR